MTGTPIDPTPPALSLPALFLRFLRFGLLAFGGPVAQIAMLRQALVDEERWVSPARFNRLLAVFQALPGPEAHELCVHFGMMARGRAGGIVAGLGFMLPGFLLMLAAAWLYVDFLAHDMGAASLLLGVQLVVVAIIVRAVVRIGQHVLEDRLASALALGGFVATLAGAPFWIPLVAAGLIAVSRPPTGVLVATAAAALLGTIWLTGRGTPILVPTVDAATVSAAALFVAGLKGGLLTFGGAYTAIPYVRHDTVGRGWVSDASFLDGVALANVLPAPLVIFATFAGYLAGGLAGALAITAGMFLPAFALSLIFYERLESVVADPTLHRVLAGVAAAVVGIIAATALGLGWSTLTRATQPLAAAGLFGAALLVLWRRKKAWIAPALMLGGALAGSVLAL